MLLMNSVIQSLLGLGQLQIGFRTKHLQSIPEKKEGGAKLDWRQLGMDCTAHFSKKKKIKLTTQPLPCSPINLLYFE